VRSYFAIPSTRTGIFPAVHCLSAPETLGVIEMRKMKSVISSDKNRRQTVIPSPPQLTDIPAANTDFLADVQKCITHDLKAPFLGMSGFSSRNLKYMSKLGVSCPGREMVQRTVAQILWRRNLVLFDNKAKASDFVAPSP